MTPQVPDVLSPSYLPEKLLHREEEYNQLVNNLKNGVNTILYGPIGSGKTALIKHAIRQLNKDIFYVDCLLYNSEYSVLREVLPANRFIVSRSNYVLFKELQRISRERRLVVCFDNFTQLKSLEVVKKMMSIGICIVLIGRVERDSPSLNQNMMSNFPTIISFKEYSVDQTFKILRERVKLAFDYDAQLEPMLRKIAEKIGGNITMALAILRAAKVRAESEGRNVWDVSIDGMLPPVDFLDELTVDERVIFKILEEHGSLPSNRLYELYAQTAKYPKSERSFRNYMENLCKKGLVKAVGDKRGRVYELSEETKGRSHGKD